MKPVYLCGPIQNRPDSECVDWRRRAAELLAPVSTLDPIRRDYRGCKQESGLAAEIVSADESDIRASSSILAMFDRPSVGTSMEIRMAFSEIKIPVYTVDISGVPRSPWLVYHTTRFFRTLEKACKFIRKGATRARDEVAVAEIFLLLDEASDGLTLRAIHEVMRMRGCAYITRKNPRAAPGDAQDLAVLLAKLVSSGRLKTYGQRPGQRYYLADKQPNSTQEILWV